MPAERKLKITVIVAGTIIAVLFLAVILAWAMGVFAFASIAIAPVGVIYMLAGMLAFPMFMCFAMIQAQKFNVFYQVYKNPDGIKHEPKVMFYSLIKYLAFIFILIAVVIASHSVIIFLMIPAYVVVLQCILKYIKLWKYHGYSVITLICASGITITVSITLSPFIRAGIWTVFTAFLGMYAMPLEWILVEIFVITVETGVLFYLLCSKFAAKYRTFMPTLLFIAVIIIVFSLRIFIPFLNSSVTIEILVISGCVLYLLFFRTGSNIKKIFWTFISFALLVSINVFSTMFIAIIGGVDSAHILSANSNERLLTMIIAATLQVGVFYFLAKQRKNSGAKNFLPPAPMLVCLVVPFISVILLFFMIISMHSDDVHISEEIIFLVSVSYLVINIAVFVLYETISREAEKNYALIAQNKQYELTEQHNSEVIEIYTKMREWRHDYNNHMQLILSMLEKPGAADKTGEAINYIKNLDEKIKSSSLEIVTGHYIADAIVSAKATLAASHDIAFEHNIYLPGDVAIESTDLCSILSNLLDNAIEACCKIDAGRYINLDMIIVKNQLNIKLTNSTNGEYIMENGRFKTTKRGDLHGLGMGHVKSIVENYGGLYDVKAESDSFTAQISIPLTRQHS